VKFDLHRTIRHRCECSRYHVRSLRIQLDPFLENPMRSPILRVLEEVWEGGQWVISVLLDWKLDNTLLMSFRVRLINALV
jgi:hypothetical protein